MMLIDKYLATYNFNEIHSIELVGNTEGVYQKMLDCDFSRSYLIKFLLFLRGIPGPICNINQMTRMGFVRLDEVPGEEVLFGMITYSPLFNSCELNFTPDSFILKTDTSIIKAVVNFQLHDRGNSVYTVSTETRIWSGNKQLLSRFGFYWLLVKPFSMLIRKSMLQQINGNVLR